MENDFSSLFTAASTWRAPAEGSFSIASLGFFDPAYAIVYAFSKGIHGAFPFKGPVPAANASDIFSRCVSARTAASASSNAGFAP